MEDTKYGYNDASKQNFAVLVKFLRSVGFKLRSLRRIVIGDLGDGYDKLIPDSKSIDFGKD